MLREESMTSTGVRVFVVIVEVKPRERKMILNGSHEGREVELASCLSL